MNKDDAIKATRNGAWAAVIVGLLTFLITATAMYFDTQDKLAYFNDPSIFIDIILVFVLAYGMYKKSRAAALFMVIYYVIARIVVVIEMQNISGIGLSFVFLYFFVKAVQGAFVFHKIEKENNPNYKAASRWVYWIGVPTSIIFLVLMSFGLLTMTSVLPSTEVQTGSEVYDQDRAKLVSENIISDIDVIEYFYSYGLTSILEGGVVMVNDRVIRYDSQEDGEIGIYEIFITDIESVTLVEKGDTFNDSIYQINNFYPDYWMQIVLSAESNGDEKFVNQLRSKIEHN